MNATVSAISNGVESRQTNYKLFERTAEVLNLVIDLKDGAVNGMEWKNGWVNTECDFVDRS